MGILTIYGRFLEIILADDIVSVKMLSLLDQAVTPPPNQFKTTLMVTYGYLLDKSSKNNRHI